MALYLALAVPRLPTAEEAGDALLLVVVIVMTILVSNLAERAIRAAFGNTAVGEASLFVNMVRVALIVFATYFVGENIFEFEMTGIAQALGLTTLLVSLGLQDVIRNFVAGLQIVMEHLFVVGDQIEVGDMRGEVLDISWRETVLRDRDGDPHVIPNATLMSGVLLRRDGKMSRRYDITCDIKPGLDLDRVAEDIQRLADDALRRRALGSGEPTEVRFMGSTANGVIASVRIYLKDIAYETRGYDAVMRAIDDRGYLADWTNESPAQQQWRP